MCCIVDRDFGNWRDDGAYHSICEEQSWYSHREEWSKLLKLLLLKYKFNQTHMFTHSNTQHAHSKYTFTWHIPPGKKKLDSSKLWKVARRISKLGRLGPI
jgi:hypothetical protein